MIIEDLKVAKLIYTIQADDAQGEILEEATYEQPRVMMFGVGRVMKSFTDGLRGLSANEDFEFTIKPENAFGYPSEQNRHPLAGHSLFVKGKVLEVRDPSIEEMNQEVERRMAENHHCHHCHHHEHGHSCEDEGCHSCHD